MRTLAPAAPRSFSFQDSPTASKTPKREQMAKYISENYSGEILTFDTKRKQNRGNKSLGRKKSINSIPLQVW